MKPLREASLNTASQPEGAPEKMKTMRSFLLLAALSLAANTPKTFSSPDMPYAITERGPFSRVWQRTTQLTNALTGAISNKVEQYTELDNGACYQDPQTGQWVDSRDIVEPTPTGAQAIHGPIRATFAFNLNIASAITLTTASGQMFESHPIGIYYRDVSSGKVALIAALQDTTGVLVPPNMVVYSNAFSGTRASVVYVYAHNGFDQSVVLEQAPPPPDLLAGFNPASSRLEIWTALDRWPAPEQQRTVTLKKGTNGLPDIVDHMLFFRDTWLPVGTAFSVDDVTQPVSGQAANIRLVSPSHTNNVPVAKSIVQLRNQSVLVESVSYPDLAPKLRTLPRAALLHDHLRANRQVTDGSRLPVAPPTKHIVKPMTLASVATLPHGVLLDWTQCPSTASSFTFSAGNTYWIPNSFYLGPNTATFQNGCFVKYGANAYLLMYGPVNFPNSGVPIIFTSMNDDSNGDIIPGSTGNPTYTASQAIWLYYETLPTTVSDAVILWANTALQEDENPATYNYPAINNVSMQNSSIGIYLNIADDSASASQTTYCNVTTPVYQNTGYLAGTVVQDCSGFLADTQFAGSTFAESGWATPDTMGAIGPNHFIEINSSEIIVFNRTTGQRVAGTILQTFLQVPNTIYPRVAPLDARILYDHRQARWLVTAMENIGTLTDNQLILAVSKSSDPVGSGGSSWFNDNWNKFLLPSPGTTVDFPTLGLDDNGVYITAVAQRNWLIAIPMQAILSGTVNGNTTVYFPSGYDGWQPCINFDAVSPSDPAFILSLGQPNTVAYRRILWNQGVASLDTSDQTLSVGAMQFSGTVQAPQACSNRIPVESFGFNANVVIRNAKLYGATTTGLNGSGGITNPDRSGCAWMKLGVNAGVLSFLDGGYVWDSATANPLSYYLPSIMVNSKGDVLMGFSGSSAITFPSVFVAGRLAGDASGVMRPVKNLRAGNVCFPHQPGDGLRLGDYSATSLDPNDQLTFWTIQEFTQSGVNQVIPWALWIAQLVPQ